MSLEIKNNRPVQLQFVGSQAELSRLEAVESSFRRGELTESFDLIAEQQPQQEGAIDYSLLANLGAYVDMTSLYATAIGFSVTCYFANGFFTHQILKSTLSTALLTKIYISTL